MGLGVWSDSVVSLLSPIICLYIVTGSDTVHNTSVSSGDSETSTEYYSCKFTFQPLLIPDTLPILLPSPTPLHPVLRAGDVIHPVLRAGDVIHPVLCIGDVIHPVL